MKILIVVESSHQGNTLKVANAMAEAAPVTVAALADAPKYDFHDYDIVGFGSGIYFGKHGKGIMEFADKLCGKETRAFVFSTSGTGETEKSHSALIGLLNKKGTAVLGSFGCKGLDKFFVFKLLGGISKGHPDEQDLKNAQSFITDVMKKYEGMERK